MDLDREEEGGKMEIDEDSDELEGNDVAVLTDESDESNKAKLQSDDVSFSFLARNRRLILLSGARFVPMATPYLLPVTVAALPTAPNAFPHCPRSMNGISSHTHTNVLLVPAGVMCFM
jgi:hypothetical protein